MRKRVTVVQKNWERVEKEDQANNKSFWRRKKRAVEDYDIGPRAFAGEHIAHEGIDAVALTGQIPHGAQAGQRQRRHLPLVHARMRACMPRGRAERASQQGGRNRGCGT